MKIWKKSACQNNLGYAITLIGNKNVRRGGYDESTLNKKSIYEGEKEVKALSEFVEKNAEDSEACQMEREIFMRTMPIGLSAMKCYFAKTGAGDAGAESEPDEGIVSDKESTLRYRNYFSVFGKISVPRTYYRCNGRPGIMPPDAQADFPGRCYSYLLR